MKAYDLKLKHFIFIIFINALLPSTKAEADTFYCSSKNESSRNVY